MVDFTRRSDGGLAAMGCLGIIVFVALSFLFSAWLVMLAVGILWGVFGILAPIGFGASMAVTFALYVLAGFFKSVTN